MKKSKKNSSTDSKKYVFVEAPSKNFTAIKLTEGKWKDVILKYGKVAFAKDENKDGTLPMKFDFDILKFPERLKDTKYDKEFTNQPPPQPKSITLILLNLENIFFNSG